MLLCTCAGVDDFTNEFDGEFIGDFVAELIGECDGKFVSDLYLWVCRRIGGDFIGDLPTSLSDILSLILLTSLLIHSIQYIATIVDNNCDNTARMILYVETILWNLYKLSTVRWRPY